VLASVAARAQPLTTAFTGDLVNVKRDFSDVIHLSLADCESADPASVSFTFTNTQTPFADNRVRLFFSTSSSCPEVATSSVEEPIDLPYWTPDQVQTNETEEYFEDNGYNVRKIFQNRATAREAAEICPSDINEPAYICVRIRNTVTNTATFRTIQFQLDTTSPEAPVLESVEPIYRGLKVSWSAPLRYERPSHYRVTATADGRSPVTKQVDSLADTASTSLTGLAGDVPYTVSVVALDDAGLRVDDSDANASAPSNELVGTPTSVAPPEETRKGSGGCSSTGAVAWLGGLVVALLRKRRALI
jgi:hypothetical protein